MKVFFLIDGGFLEKKFNSRNGFLTSEIILQLVDSAVSFLPSTPSQYVHRIYYYDSQPLSGKKQRPISNSTYDFSHTKDFKRKQNLLHALKLTDKVSVREGTIAFRGWILKNQLQKSSNPSDSDFRPNLQQKGVDIKIALDFAWIAQSKLAERIIFISGDSDFVPVIKDARRHGIQVALFTLGHNIQDELRLNCDFIREEKVSEILKNGTS